MNTKRKFDFYNIIYLLIAVVFILDISLFIDYKNISNDIQKEVVEDIKEEETIIINQSSVIRVRFEDYVFEVPEEYKYKINDDIFYISFSSFSLNMQFVDMSYNDILASKNTIKNNYEKYGYIVNDINEVKKDNNRYLVYSIEDEGVNHFVMYVDINKNDIFVIEVVDKYDNFNNIINKINPLLNSVVYSKI